MPLKQTGRLKRTVIVLTADQVLRLDNEAQNRVDNRSRLVRQAVDEFLDRVQKKRTQNREEGVA